MQRFCYSCKIELTRQNSSQEHIIPNALGGKLKAVILCKKCNNNLGSSCDSLLSKALSPFSNMINHSKDHGKVQPVQVTANGVPTKILPGGQDFLSKIEFNRGTNSFRIFGTENIEIEAQKLLRNLYKKNKITAEQYESSKLSITKNKQTIHNPIVCFQTTFENIWLGLLKIAINFAIHKGIHPKHLQKAISTLQTNDQECAHRITTYFSAEVFPSQEGAIFHTLILIGDPEENLLYCFISLYGILQTISILSTTYKGPTKKEIYLYDIWNEEEHTVNLYSFRKLSRKQAINLFSSEKISEPNNLKIRLNKFLSHFILPENNNLNKTIKDLARFLTKETFQEANRTSEILTEGEFREFIYRKTIEFKNKNITTLKLVKNINLKKSLEKLPHELYELYLSERAQNYLCTIMSDFIMKKLLTSCVPDCYFSSNEFFTDLLSYISERSSHLPFHKKILALATFEKVKQLTSTFSRDNFFQKRHFVLSSLPSACLEFLQKHENSQQK